MPQEPSSRPQLQFWIKFLDPWMQDFYPVLAGVWHRYREIHNSSQHLHWIKIGFPDFRDRHLRKTSENLCVPAEKPKSAVYTQKTKKNRYLGIRCCDPNLSGGYQNCSLGMHH